MTAPELPPGDWRLRVYGARGPSSGVTTRQYPRVAERRRAIELQNNRCLYCELPIGTAIWRHSRTVFLRTNWDHFIPYAYLARNPSSNWVLSCHVCNNIKSCRMFDTVQQAREVILPIRESKGYESPKEVMLRIGLTAGEDPWPDSIRPKRHVWHHAARLIRPDFYLTACGLEVAKVDVRPIAKHQRRCARCLIQRELPVVPPSLSAS
ncbi:HNH endonuclease [Streptomyces sp. NPDC052043]|uniref:HNH endonuclease n=1 Tax=Streptomyces sp. NPDC052043 TaxID=3365684 RepID=UPI0037D89400